MNFSYFHLFKRFDENMDGLLKFKEKFECDVNEVRKYDIDYAKYYNHHSAVELTYKRYTTNNFKKIFFEDVTYNEYTFIEKCKNGELIYLDPVYKNNTIQSYGFDCSSFYPAIKFKRIDDSIKTSNANNERRVTTLFYSIVYTMWPFL